MATRTSIAERATKLLEQAAATRHIAEAYPEGQLKDLAIEAAKSLESAARRKVAESMSSSVLALPSSATEMEVDKARRLRAVQHGDDVFLPTSWESKVELPNVLLRSSLFSAVRPGTSLLEKKLGSPKKYTLYASGPQLGDYDRRVFAACLKYHSSEPPLPLGGNNWITTTYWQMSKALKVAYTANVHRAIRKSLARLNSTTLDITIGKGALPVNRLIDVEANADAVNHQVGDEQLKGSESIVFRVPKSLAFLFGPNEWSHISEQALHKTEGLASWLAAFYSTHSEPYSLTMKEVYEFSGSTCPRFEFRRRLKSALESLQKDTTPEDFRVAKFDLTKHSLLVRLASW